MNRPASSNMLLGFASDYQSVPAGAYAVAAQTTRAGHNLAEIPPVACTFLQNRQYTGIAVGNAETWPRARLLFFEEVPDQQLTPNQAEIHAIDGYPHSARVDVILNNIVAFHDLTFGSRGDGIVLAAKEYVGKAIESGKYDDPIGGPIPLPLEGGKSYTLIVIGPSAGSQHGMLLAPED